jgi:hypothetical protein
MSEKSALSTRDKVRQRAKGLCEYCLSPESFSSSTFEVEHIFPISLGGKTILKNLALSCPTCNRHKLHRISISDPETQEKVQFYNPRKDVWNEHFAWNEDFSKIIHLTPKGKVTILALKLNRESVQNLRRLLHLVGKHPQK